MYYVHMHMLSLQCMVHGYKSIWDAANDVFFCKRGCSPSVAELSWLIVGLACTGSDSTPAEPNGHARETTELHMLNIYSSVKEVVYHIMQVTTVIYRHYVIRMRIVYLSVHY